MSARRFEGRAVIVTGGASGIGAATARRLATEGARILVADIDEAGAQRVASDLGDAASFRRVDVAERTQVEELVAAAVERFGRLDILFNNAGVGSLGETPDIDPDQWHRIIAVDLHSVFYACRAAIPHFRSSGGGVIVNTASISGIAADYGFAAYNAAKGALVNYTRTLAIDHARENIRVNAVCPGLIDTAATRVLLDQPSIAEDYLERIPMGRVGTAEDVAGAVAFLASDDARYVTGHCLVVDGGITCHTGQPNFTALARRLFGGAG